MMQNYESSYSHLYLLSYKKKTQIVVISMLLYIIAKHTDDCNCCDKNDCYNDNYFCDTFDFVCVSFRMTKTVIITKSNMRLKNIYVARRERKVLK